MSTFYDQNPYSNYGSSNPSVPTGNANEFENPFAFGAGNAFNSPPVNNPPPFLNISPPENQNTGFGQPPINPTPVGPPPRNFPNPNFNPPPTPPPVNPQNLFGGAQPFQFYGAIDPVQDTYETFSPQANTSTPTYSVNAAGINTIANAINLARDCDTFGIQNYSEPADSERIRVNDYVNFQSGLNAPITESKYFDFI